MTDYPTGTVTFLLTDVESSTVLFAAHPELVRDLVSQHDSIIGSCVERHGGVIVKSKGEGDSVFAVFRRATDAVAAACDIHEAFKTFDWPNGILMRVRIGIHTGDAELRDQDYYGAAVNMAARLRSAGHGGQTLLSQSTHSLVGDNLPQDITIKRMGAYQLRGFKAPVTVFQASRTGGSSEFPLLNAPAVQPGNLPVELSDFVGREREISYIKLALSGTRLLTLTGAGGTGKTRLALRVARDMQSDFAHGAWWVDLSGLGSGSSVLRAIGTSIGMRDSDEDSMDTGVLARLRGQEVLLILDNCEHIVDLCADAADRLLRSCCDLTLLATSRDLLSVQGEQVYVVPTLGLPDEGASVDTALESDAVMLFAARARLRQAAFEISESNVAAIQRICHQLDGIPLSIELAAAHVDVLSPEQIASQVEYCFGILKTRLRTPEPRHRSLHAAMEWSYELLDEVERTLFRRLSVFRGWFTLEAAQAVAQDRPETPVFVLEHLANLHQKSMVVVDRDSVSGTYYRLLEPLRQYGLERLAETDEAAKLRRRHASHFAEVAQQSEIELRGPNQAEWLTLLDQTHDNLRAALRWTTEVGETATGLRLAGSLWWFWFIRGHLLQGRQYLETLLAQADPSDQSAAKAKALHASGTLAIYLGLADEAKNRLEVAYAIRERRGDTAGCAKSRNNLGLVHRLTGAYAEAQRCFAESLQEKEATNDLRGKAVSMSNLALVNTSLGDYSSARRLAAQSLDIRRELGDKRGEATSLMLLGRINQYTGDYQSALRNFDQSLALFRRVGDMLRVSEITRFVGHAAHDMADLKAARSCYTDSLRIERDIGGALSLAQTLTLLGELELDEGNTPAALDCFGEALQLLRHQETGNELVEALTGQARAECASGELQSAMSTLARCQRVLGLMGHVPRIALFLETVACVIVNDSRPVLALRLYGAAGAARRYYGIPRPPMEVLRFERALAAKGLTLDDVTAASAIDAGSNLALEQACADAAAVLPP